MQILYELTRLKLSVFAPKNVFKLQQGKKKCVKISPDRTIEVLY